MRKSLPRCNYGDSPAPLPGRAARAPLPAPAAAAAAGEGRPLPAAPGAVPAAEGSRGGLGETGGGGVCVHLPAPSPILLAQGREGTQANV